jgi:hypothetical protein
MSNKLLQILILMCRRRRRRRHSGVAAAAAAAQSLPVHLNQSLKPLLFSDEEEAEDQKGKMILQRNNNDASLKPKKVFIF